MHNNTSLIFFIGGWNAKMPTLRGENISFDLLRANYGKKGVQWRGVYIGTLCEIPSNEEYACPVCDKAICADEESARHFLKQRD